MQPSNSPRLSNVFSSLFMFTMIALLGRQIQLDVVAGRVVQILVHSQIPLRRRQGSVAELRRLENLADDLRRQLSRPQEDVRQ